jgi:hypothetical protein
MLVVERGVKIKLNPNLWVNPENEKLYYDEEFLTEVAPDDESRTKFDIGDHMGNHIVVVDSLDKESVERAIMNKKHENYLSLYSEATSKGWLCSDVLNKVSTCSWSKKKSTYGGTTDVHSEDFKEARELHMVRARDRRRKVMKILNGDWKDNIIEDHEDYEGYTDSLLAKRHNRLIRYRLAPINLPCSLDNPDIVLNSTIGIDVVDIEPWGCVSVRVNGEESTVKVRETLGFYSASCSEGNTHENLKYGDKFTCLNRIWTVGSISTDTQCLLASNKCRNGGTLNDGSCYCINGYTGNHCQISPSLCSYNNEVVNLDTHVISHSGVQQKCDNWDNTACYATPWSLDTDGRKDVSRYVFTPVDILIAQTRFSKS